MTDEVIQKLPNRVVTAVQKLEVGTRAFTEALASYVEEKETLQGEISSLHVEKEQVLSEIQEGTRKALQEQNDALRKNATTVVDSLLKLTGEVAVDSHEYTQLKKQASRTEEEMTNAVKKAVSDEKRASEFAKRALENTHSLALSDLKNENKGLKETLRRADETIAKLEMQIESLRQTIVDVSQSQSAVVNVGGK